MLGTVRIATPEDVELLFDICTSAIRADPLEEPRQFRGWLQLTHGVILDQRNWTREWGWIVQA